MRSMRTRLIALWLMLAASAVVTGYLLVEFYRQSGNAQVARAEEQAVRACRDIADVYARSAAGGNGPTGRGDEMLKARLMPVVQAALARAPGVEGGIWQVDAGSLAYAFPTYEGTGPKTDLPVAEVASIREVNGAALRSERPISMRQTGRSQVLIVHACPLPGPFSGVTAWTMTRVFTGQGRSYNQLLVGLAVLAITVLGSAIWLGRILISWSRKLARLEASLTSRNGQAGDLPALPPTGERELDRLVDALNATGKRVAEERRRAGAAERLAALGRLAAGIAHEIRNPIAAMRLKAENAMAAGDEARRSAALASILEQIGRLDGLLRDLLAMTQRREPQLAAVDLTRFLNEAVEAHRELAAHKGVKLVVAPVGVGLTAPKFDAGQVRRALDNLILNAIQNTPPGGAVTIAGVERDGKLHLRVSDTGSGVPAEIRDGLFEPFVTTRPDGTGLGLAIVLDIARAHGGDAHHVPGASGATFEIELPCRPS
jgi:signal transduction histidine kinase